jgi:tRNA (guanine-N7-)-methyltransferase
MEAACLPDAALPADCWRQIFGNDHPVGLEVGPGRGDFLLASAERHPTWNFFAIEHSASRTREIAATLAARGVDNARVLCGDAACLIELLPAASVAAIYVQFPDPWWKRRHHKRRVWTPRFAAALHRALLADGTVELVTDVADYFALAQTCLAGEPGLELMALGGAPELLTSFARKAARQGTPIHRSVHRKRRD